MILKQPLRGFNGDTMTARWVGECIVQKGFEAKVIECVIIDH